MVENDAKFVDFGRLLANWAQNVRKWFQIGWFGTSLGSLNDNDDADEDEDENGDEDVNEEGDNDEDEGEAFALGR